MPTPVVNSARDRDIMALVIDQNKSIKDVAQEYGVHPTRVSQILAEQTKRDQVMAFLARNPDRWFNSREIAMALHLDINKVQFVADSLRKTGRGRAEVLPSSGSAGGDHKMLTNIHLTPRGMDEIKKRMVDMVAEASTKETIVTEPAPVVEAIPELVVERIPEGVLERVDPKLIPGIIPIELEPSVPSPGEAPEKAELAIHDIPRFPLIHQLTNRNEKLQQASKLIEAAGPYDELALAVLAKLDDFTALEREILEYVKKYGMVEDA